MILVIGAASSGKLEYARSMGYIDSDISDGKVTELPVVNNLQDIVFENPSSIDALYDKLIDKDVVICNEVGSGVIPVDKIQREAREATGRLCIRLAERAEKVVRLVCGIPTVLK
ncbi:MAG: bifunctional adenosylcobinamide kinase/adenosylcobinamide-phosphate guanylyltransferase [Gudongella sp.]|jgi:adenosyl cobinamide kinase/adenosyl cobinamide phosphate guanylyltransferase|nr:bifunctional adenosylcobinamide kinase/adenosylcobinamide-phosphate guanylyltransferase [Gudongella sp.]